MEVKELLPDEDVRCQQAQTRCEWSRDHRDLQRRPERVPRRTFPHEAVFLRPIKGELGNVVLEREVVLVAPGFHKTPKEDHSVHDQAHNNKRQGRQVRPPHHSLG